MDKTVTYYFNFGGRRIISTKAPLSISYQELIEITRKKLSTNTTQAKILPFCSISYTDHKGERKIFIKK